MSRIVIHEFCVPPTATSQQKGCFVVGGKPRFFTKTKVKQAHNLLASLLMPHRPVVPLTGPLALSVTWTFPWRSGDCKRVRLSGTKPHDTRPDLDNLEKGLIDCMTQLGFWGDDGQIAKKRTSKNRGDKPGLFIVVEKYEEELSLEG